MYTHENSVVLVPLVHFGSIALYTGSGTWYSVMKFPFVSLTFLVTPRLIVCLRLQDDSTPPETDEATESGRSYSPKELGSMGLFHPSGLGLMQSNCYHSPRRIHAGSGGCQWDLLRLVIFVITSTMTSKLVRQGHTACIRAGRGLLEGEMLAIAEGVVERRLRRVIGWQRWPRVSFHC